MGGRVDFPVSKFSGRWRFPNETVDGIPAARQISADQKNLNAQAPRQLDCLGRPPPDGTDNGAGQVARGKRVLCR